MVQRNKEHHNNPKGRPVGSRNIDGSKGKKQRYDPDSTAGYDWFNDEEAFDEPHGRGSNTSFLDDDPWNPLDLEWLDDSNRERSRRGPGW